MTSELRKTRAISSTPHNCENQAIEASKLKRKIARIPLTDQTNIIEKNKRPRVQLFQKDEAETSKMSTTTANLESLPKELLIVIFKLLPALSQGRVNLVCKRFQFIMKNYQVLDPFDLDPYAVIIENSMRHKRSLRDYIKRAKHPELSTHMRSTLVDWIIEVGEEFKMQSETVFMTVAFIDRYLSLIDVPLPKSKFQLVGVAALLLAAKFEELVAPTISDLVFICDNTYTAEEIIDMEANVLNILSFNMRISTAKIYTQHLLNITFDQEPKIDIPTKLVMTSLANYLTEISLLDYNLSMQRPSRIAAAALCLARNSLNYSVWPTYLQEETYFSVKDLEPCARALFNIVTDGSKYQAAFLKYSQNVHQKASSHNFLQFWPN